MTNRFDQEVNKITLYAYFFVVKDSDLKLNMRDET